MDQIKNEQEDRQSVEKAHEVLQQKHSELSKKAKGLVHRTDEEEVHGSSSTRK